MGQWYETVSMLIPVVLGPVKMLSAEALHETRTFLHLSSYLFRS